MKGLRRSAEKIVLVFLGVCLSLFNYAQDVPTVKCGIEKEMKKVYEKQPDSQEEAMAFEGFTLNFIQNRKKLKNAYAENYVIPVVFHVFGTEFAGKTVTDEKIQTALEKLNDDFNGLNDDFDAVDADFESIKSTLNIQFKLAQLDPDGNTTTGITYNSTLAGFGNGSGNDSQIKQYAWDNYKYMNVYIVLDLYNDGVTNNSGVAWYPNIWMSDNNLARVVYNGRYLYGNTDKEFASVLTHEFGHWLNLIHTFEGGCTEPNDRVDDTPAANTSSMGCRNVYNCKSEETNGENYMDYNVTCYKMYTAGQVDRAVAALQHPARITLWQNENLAATGLLTDSTNVSATSLLQDSDWSVMIYPNPAKDKLFVKMGSKITNDGIKIKIYSVQGQLMYNNQFKNLYRESEIPLNINLSPGIYNVEIRQGNEKMVRKLVIMD